MAEAASTPGRSPTRPSRRSGPEPPGARGGTGSGRHRPGAVVAESLVEALEPGSRSTARPVLVARAAEATRRPSGRTRGPRRRGRRRRALRDGAGAPRPGARRGRADADYVTFTSSSTVRYFVEALGDGASRAARARRLDRPGDQRDGARGGASRSPSRPSATTSTAWSRRCSPTPGPAGRGRAEPADHLPLRLRLRGRIRRRLPGGDGRIAPEPSVIDITHGVGRHAVRQGAIVLADALPYTPSRASTSRSSTPASAGAPRGGPPTGEGRMLVGPDNGLLGPAAAALGGASEAVDLSDSPFGLRARHGHLPRSRPVRAGRRAARRGGPARRPGSAGPGHPDRARAAPAEDLSDRVVAHVLYADGFGNLRSTSSRRDLGGYIPRAGGPGPRSRGGRNRVTVPAPAPSATSARRRRLLYRGLVRSMALAVNRESAAQVLGLGPDDEVAVADQPSSAFLRPTTAAATRPRPWPGRRRRQPGPAAGSDRTARQTGGRAAGKVVRGAPRRRPASRPATTGRAARVCDAARARSRPVAARSSGPTTSGSGAQAGRGADRGPSAGGWAVIGVGLNVAIAARSSPS